MVLNLGVHHCGDHPQGVTVPLPEVTAALLPVRGSNTKTSIILLRVEV